MARVKLSLLSAISGRIESTEFSMTKGGCVAKKRKPPKRLDSFRQHEARTVFARRIADWHSMTTAAKTEWNAYAATHPVVNRLGNSKYITGFNWFMKLRDTGEGIALPVGLTAQPIILDPECYEDGPYYFTFTWPAGSDDDWTITLHIGSLVYNSPKMWPRNWLSVETITKGNIPISWYTMLTSRGVFLYYGTRYVIGASIRKPYWWPSVPTYRVFYCQPTTSFSYWLKMDDNAANPNVVDSYGHHDQTFEGTNPNTEDHSVPGVDNLALSFNGTDNKIVLTTASYQAYLGEYQPFTIAIWWKPWAPIGVPYEYIIGNADLVNPFIAFIVNNQRTGITIRSRWGGSNYTASKLWITSDVSNWRHLAVVRNGRRIQLFYNGVSGYDNTADEWQGAFYAPGKAFSIGCNQGYISWARGDADDVHLFDHALTDAEVASLAGL